MGDDNKKNWYDHLGEDYKEVAKTHQLQDGWGDMPESYQIGLAELHRLSRSPQNSGWSLSQIRENNTVDEDVYNAIKGRGLEGRTWGDITSDEWNGVYDDYLKGYNEFSKAHPNVPYGLRMDNSWRAIWDKDYEGYKGSADDLAKAQQVPTRSEIRAARREEKAAQRKQRAAEKAAARQERQDARMLRQQDREAARRLNAEAEAYAREQRAKDRMAREAEKTKNTQAPAASGYTEQQPYDFSDTDNMDNWSLDKLRAYAAKNKMNFSPGFIPDGETPYDTPKNDVSNGGKQAMAAARREGKPVDMNPHDHTLQGDASRTQQNGGASTQPQQTEKLLDLQGMIDLLNKDKAQKDADIAKREAALKRAKTFAAIGDALSAFHTAYSNARGVQPMVPAGTSLSGKWRERYDNLMKEKDANEQTHLQNLQKLQQMKDTADYQKESIALRKQQEERLQATAKAKIDYDLSRADAIKSKADLDAAVADAKIRLMEAGMSEKEASAQAKLIVANSTAAKNYAQAEKYRSGSSGSGGNVGAYTKEEEYTYDKRGRKVGVKVKRTPVGNNSNSKTNNGKKVKVDW